MSRSAYLAKTLDRRDFLAAASLLVSSGLIHGDDAPASDLVHQQLLDVARRQQEQRRSRFTAVKSAAELNALQLELRTRFLDLLDGLPKAAGPPSAKVVASIDAPAYTIEKLVYESFPGHFVPALLYLPKNRAGRVPGILSPCGHSAVGKAANTYQVLHANLVERGYAVLTYDPVGQGERSQFWDAQRGQSKFNLTCGEHAVLGNPLYLLGTSLARYRIWDGLRGIDYLASLPTVDPDRIGCVGSSGGGTLTAYIAALDPRVRAAVISCYITTLPRRMANRIQEDPDADPEQDIFGFVSNGIDHAGLLALRTPRPTLVCSARFDFFPLAGAVESCDEAKRLYKLAGAGENFSQVEAPEKHGLTLPLRRAAYGWFDRWLADSPSDEPAGPKELPTVPRPAKDLLVCDTGQVNLTYRSRHLLPLAVEEFRKQTPTRKTSLKDLLRLDPENAEVELEQVLGKVDGTHIVLVNGNETAAWQEEKELLAALGKAGLGATVVSPRGVAKLRPPLEIAGHSYTDPLCGVEENIAYNAFLVGKSLLGMRVADVLKAVTQIRTEAKKPKRLVLCGRRDAALVVCLAAAIEPTIQQVAVEELALSFWALFATDAPAINAASVLPGLLRDYGDVSAILAAIAPRRVLVAAPTGKPAELLHNLDQVEGRFAQDPQGLLDWLKS
jgi:dienelactone hydrolase